MNNKKIAIAGAGLVGVSAATFIITAGRLGLNSTETQAINGTIGGIFLLGIVMLLLASKNSCLNACCPPHANRYSLYNTPSQDQQPQPSNAAPQAYQAPAASHSISVGKS